MVLIINTYSILAKLTTVFTVFLDKYLDVSSSHEKSEAGRIGAFYFDPGEKGSSRGKGVIQHKSTSTRGKGVVQH